MDYFTILNLDREPFSNSPDPDFFFQSGQHVECLQKLELALRLKRGLNVVIGAVGSGKTTLCRTLLKKFAPDDTIASHLILDPSFHSPLAFLKSICSLIAGTEISGSDEHRFKERIKHHLYQKGVEENKTVILIIDEGQKLPLFCLEILRELLNYETNDHKLLQIVLFAQEEFQEILDSRANLADRVNLIHFLGPMSFADTREMIHFRIGLASDQARAPELFTGPALGAIYRATGGYPRKIINLCHQCILALIVQNRTRVGWRLVRSCTNRSMAQHARPPKNSRSLVFWALAVFLSIGLLNLLAPGVFPVSLDRHTTVATRIPNKKPMVRPVDGPLTESTVSIAKSPDNLQGSLPVSPDRAIALSGTPDIPEPVQTTAAADTQPERQTVLQPAPPSLIGVVTVRKKDTLGQMVKVIYGDFRNRYLNDVLAANPRIGHADAIRAGDTIAFPAIPVSFVKRSSPLWWLKLEQVESLDSAFRRAIDASVYKGGPLTRIISQWNRNTGLAHGIYVSGYFSDPAAAEELMAQLPPELSGSAEIISGWQPGTVLFSDPFLGKGY